ncbi:unnamed protein product, partial [Prorocentrum cordatum]
VARRQVGGQLGRAPASIEEMVMTESILDRLSANDACASESVIAADREQDDGEPPTLLSGPGCETAAQGGAAETMRRPPAPLRARLATGWPVGVASAETVSAAAEVEVASTVAVGEDEMAGANGAPEGRWASSPAAVGASLARDSPSEKPDRAGSFAGRARRNFNDVVDALNWLANCKETATWPSFDQQVVHARILDLVPPTAVLGDRGGLPPRASFNELMHGRCVHGESAGWDSGRLRGAGQITLPK